VPCSVYTAAQSMLHIVSSRQRRYTRSVCDTVVVRQKTRMLSHLLGLFLFCLSTHTLTARHRAYLQTLLGRIAWAESKGTDYCYRCSVICVSVCLSVCLLDTAVNPTKWLNRSTFRLECGLERVQGTMH